MHPISKLAISFDKISNLGCDEHNIFNARSNYQAILKITIMRLAEKSARNAKF